LESIWHFTGRFTPQGNIGKYPDEAIELWVGWDGEPGSLISALIATHWIDAHADFRLLVHDWPQHADNATKLALKRSGQAFCLHAVSTVSRQCGDTVQQNVTPLRLPVPVPVPEPVPEPGPVPVPKAKTKTKAPAKVKPLPDPRGAEFKTAFWDAFKLANNVPPAWDAKEATNLSRFLKANPTITAEQWRHILFNRSQSPINQKASLSVWVARALSWIDAPADEWGKPLDANKRGGYRNNGRTCPDMPRALTADELEAKQRGEDAEERQAYKAWSTMSDRFKTENPWRGKTFEMAVN
jgi:hypothetical protein